MRHKSKPVFAVQWHPEASPGPYDTEFLFDEFAKNMEAKHVMPKLEWIKKVLVLGSGAIKIGEAAEFDYCGSQCLKALKEEGIETVLINPNIATIQTDPRLSGKVYLLPVTPEYVEKVIAKEHPDGILLGLRRTNRAQLWHRTLQTGHPRKVQRQSARHTRAGHRRHRRPRTLPRSHAQSRRSAAAKQSRNLRCTKPWMLQRKSVTQSLSALPTRWAAKAQVLPATRGSFRKSPPAA